MEYFIKLLPQKLRRELYQGVSLMFFAIFYLCRIKKIVGISKRITMVDFRYAGNLRSFSDYCAKELIPFELGFMCADPEDYESLKKSLPKNIKLLSRFSFKDMLWAYQSDVFLTSIMLRRFLKITKKFAPHIKFVQLFHSLNLLGEPKSWFNVMGEFDKLFCASECIVKMFEEQTNQTGKFISTGYAVVDELYTSVVQRDKILVRLGLDPLKKTILISPTLTSALDWNNNKLLYPYSMELLSQLNSWALLNNAQIIFRNHPHEKFDETIFNNLNGIFLLKAQNYKNVSEQLIAADLMITDLSGIGGYFIALQKPMIFLESTATYSKENDLFYFLSPEELPGPKVRDYNQLIEHLNQFISGEITTSSDYVDLQKNAYNKLFGNCFDGMAAKRYKDNLLS